ncbi:MAG: hypothetical protein AB8E87_02440 [Prochlorococcus sp.]|nr:hypothetical protein [Prochlorococcaceae cyanobacterium Fu_MAG_50]
MSFDPRSLERLRDLGRQLPEPLPDPQSTDPDGRKSKGTPAPQQRHRVETEQNPEALFHELMQVSPDGTVPEHLIERLKHAEASRKPQQSSLSHQPLKTNQPLATNQPLKTPSASPEGRPSSAKGKINRPNRPKPTPGSEEEQLYVDFGQLLLEED